ncbi:Z1 domain-containing protein, partial [bacterium]|nr:Z1 domain-containing protein [bacterium]
AYGLINDVVDYPDFELIYEHIETIIATVAPVAIDDDANKIEHHDGIHLCIDNCAWNYRPGEGEHIRLLYPEAPMEFSPAFIVVGGATLSRGLTLEGLVSSYFLRTSGLGDSLMQMGRWFGYRKGYELLPRIWMTSDTASKFRFLAGVEQSLREEVKRYEVDKKKPEDFGPRIQTHPLVSWLRLTSTNRMQGAQPAKFDYSGINNQTTIFSDDKGWLNENIENTEEFLSDLGTPVINRDCLLWEGVPFPRVSKYLAKMNFHERSRVFSKIETFLNWFDAVCSDAGYKNWNIILGTRGVDKEQPKDPGNQYWKISDRSCRKVERSRLEKESRDGSFSIGVLLSRSDRIADVDEESFGPVKISELSNEGINAYRKEAGQLECPQLIIYRIDKNSGVRADSEWRVPLNAPADVIGLVILLPGTAEKGSAVRSVQIEITESDLEGEDIPDVE